MCHLISYYPLPLTPCSLILSWALLLLITLTLPQRSAVNVIKIFFLHRRRRLCTIVHYRFLFISIKFCNGGGAARAGWLSSFIHLLLHPPQYGPWNLPCGLLVHKTNYAPMIYTALCIMSHVIWAPNGTRLSAGCRFTGPKKLSISRAQPHPTGPRNGYARIQTLCTGL